MHEATIANNIIQIAIKVAEKNRAKKVNRISIIAGELQLLDFEALKFAFKALSQDIPLLEKTKLEITCKPAKFKCLKCGEEWSLKRTTQLNEDNISRIHFTPDLIVNYLKCPKCGFNDFTIINGKELYVKEIEITT